MWNNRSQVEKIIVKEGITSLSKECFSDFSSLKTFVLPSTVTAILERAFAGCGYLNEVTISSQIKSIAKEAFYQCTNLDKILIPASVTSIGKDIIWTGYTRGNDGRHSYLAVVYTTYNSAAHKYAAANNISYKIDLAQAGAKITNLESKYIRTGSTYEHYYGTIEASLTGDISPFRPVAAATVERAVLSQTTDSDPAGSTFNLLQARGSAKSKSSIKIKWKRVSGATGYIIYGNKCGRNNRYKKITTVTGTSFTQKKLKKGTYYKYLVVAVNGNKALATSKTIHVVTKGGKNGNYRKVKVKKSKVSLRVGKTSKIKAKAYAEAGGRKVKKHRGIRFESSNPSVATVTSKGVIRGVSRGTCYIYAYAQNGVCKKIRATVK